MRKAQVMSAVALMLVLGINATAYVFAGDETAVQGAGTGTVTKDETMRVVGAEESTNSVASKYPGLDKYLTDLANKYDKHSDDAGYMAALSEATEAAKLLKGISSTNSVAEQAGEVSAASRTVSSTSRNETVSTYGASSTAVVAEASRPEIKEQPERVATNVAVKVEEKPVVQHNAEVAQHDDSESIAKEDVKSDEAAEEPDTDDVELPNTGIEKKIGVGEMILVSVAVVVATVGATLAVLHSRKK